MTVQQSVILILTWTFGKIMQTLYLPLFALRPYFSLIVVTRGDGVVNYVKQKGALT